MLTDIAQQYHLDVLCSQHLPLTELAQMMKDQFHTRERTQALLRGRDLLYLDSFILKKSK